LTRFAYHVWRDPEAVERYARAAVDMAEQLDAAAELSAALEPSPWPIASAGSCVESMQVSLRRLALSREARFTDQRERIDILINVCDALFKVGEYAQVMSFAMEMRICAINLRDATSLVYGLNSNAAR